MKKSHPTSDFILPGGSDGSAAVRPCAAEGCASAGIYPAPKSPSNLGACVWFCLEHVRTYNRQWNYFADMDRTAINNYVDHATTWERPSWPFGARGHGHGHGKSQADQSFADPFDLAEEIFGRRTRTGNSRNGKASPVLLADEVRAALRVLELPATADWYDNWLGVKQQYKTLVKKHHPDTNGADACQEKLKAINQALAVLRKHRRQAA